MEEYKKFPIGITRYAMEKYRRQITEMIQQGKFPIRYELPEYHEITTSQNVERLKKELNKLGYGVEIEYSERNGYILVIH